MSVTTGLITAGAGAGLYSSAGSLPAGGQKAAKVGAVVLVAIGAADVVASVFNRASAGAKKFAEKGGVLGSGADVIFGAPLPATGETTSTEAIAMPQGAIIKPVAGEFVEVTGGVIWVKQTYKVEAVVWHTGTSKKAALVTLVARETPTTGEPAVRTVSAGVVDVPPAPGKLVIPFNVNAAFDYYIFNTTVDLSLLVDGIEVAAVNATLDT